MTTKQHKEIVRGILREIKKANTLQATVRYGDVLQAPKEHIEAFQSKAVYNLLLELWDEFK